MNIFDNLQLTPETIGSKSYTIPIYQRLFEWDSERITQLLNDLKGRQSSGKAYYIGMLTSTANNDLVDGQQRFTVMILMGIAFSEHYTPWEEFITNKDKNELRLKFSARPEDQEYLEFLIKQIKQEQQSPNYENKKMKQGLECIKQYLNSHFESKESKEKFAEYVYKNMTFFVTSLPDNYRQSSLNKYFERMNSTGRNLEGHEIIKVKLLHKLSSEKDFFTKAWNRITDMDTPCFRVRRAKGEDESGMKERIRKAISSDRKNPQALFDENLLNGFKETEEENASGSTIKDVKESEKAPAKNQSTGSGSHAVMSFSDFLLQCLYRFLHDKGKETGDITVFFNKANLVSTFEKRLLDQVDSQEIKDFFKCLVRYRILMDIYFIRILDGQGDYDYDLETPFLEKEDDVRTLKMFESMLYVNSSPVTYYQWFNTLMDIVDTDTPVEPDALFKKLKSMDDQTHPKEKLNYESLNYEDVDRYWFWRLDFYIWLNREDLFKAEGDDTSLQNNGNRRAIDVAEKYVFKRRRSIEHIAPQTPLQEDTLKLGKEDRDSFGNLVMISSEQNSALSNSIYQEKKARVEAFLDNSRSGSIESLKMLHAFTFNKTWNAESIKKHGETMFQILKQSYPDSDGEADTEHEPWRRIYFPTSDPPT